MFLSVVLRDLNPKTDRHRQTVKIHLQLHQGPCTPTFWDRTQGPEPGESELFHTVHSSAVSYDWNENISTHSFCDWPEYYSKVTFSF